MQSKIELAQIFALPRRPLSYTKIAKVDCRAKKYLSFINTQPALNPFRISQLIISRIALFTKISFQNRENRPKFHTVKNRMKTLQGILHNINFYHNPINIRFFYVFLPQIQLRMTGQSINRIRVALAEQNKTNRWLAEQMGKSEITISRWVQNKAQPSLEQLLQVAKFLSISPKDLINEVDIESTEYQVKP